MRKVLVVLVAIALIGLAFFGGWSLRGSKEDKKYSDKLEPASSLMQNLTQGTDAEAEYTKTSGLYQETTPKEAFLANAEKIKGYTVASSNSYVGDIDNVVLFELTKDEKLINVSVTTAQENGKMAVTAFNVSE